MPIRKSYSPKSVSSDATFDWVDVDKYLSDYDNSVEQNDNTQRELERIAPKCPHYFFTSSMRNKTHNYNIIVIIIIIITVFSHTETCISRWRRGVAVKIRAGWEVQGVQVYTPERK